MHFFATMAWKSLLYPQFLVLHQQIPPGILGVSASLWSREPHSGCEWMWFIQGVNGCGFGAKEGNMCSWIPAPSATASAKARTPGPTSGSLALRLPGVRSPKAPTHCVSIG